MGLSVYEKLCIAKKAPIRKKCPVTAKAPRGEVLYDVPNTFIRNVIVLTCRLHKIAGELLASRRRKDRSKCFPARQRADAVEELVVDYLRSVRGDSENVRFTLFRNWEYSVHSVG